MQWLQVQIVQEVKGVDMASKHLGWQCERCGYQWDMVVDAASILEQSSDICPECKKGHGRLMNVVRSEGGKSPTIEVVEGIRRPRIERGCDWGVERDVLVRLVDKPGAVKELWWMLGFKCWSGRGETSYYRATLSLVAPGEHSGATTVGGAGSYRHEIHEGRFSAKAIKANAAKINEFFGADVAHLIQRGKTVVVTV